MKFLYWVINEVWEKINIPGIYRTLKELGKKHGRRFFWAALIWELIEDVLFPYLSWLAGVPELIPLFLIFHFEPISYPVIFWMFRMYDRARGREPWEPNRTAQSSYWRSVIKVLVYKVAIAGWFSTIMLSLHISPFVITIYIALMGTFGFVFERIWHDSNYGIRADDTVEIKRNLVKAMTYRVVSVMIMYPLFRAILKDVPWNALVACQMVGFILYFILETMWSKSGWGVEVINDTRGNT